MQITATYDEMKAAAASRRREAAARRPEPVPVNIEAVMAFTQPREFAWGGVGYRAPPLPFREGVRLLVAANALRDLRGAPAPLALRAAMRVAAHVVRRNVVPRRWLERWTWRFARRAFTDGSPEQLEHLIRWLLYVPDATPMAEPDGPSKIDFMDGLLGMASRFPGWLDTRGLPLSWAHWVYATRDTSRDRPRQQVLTAEAMRVAGLERQAFQEWYSERREAAGWN